jgi:hypothetical protein
MKTDKESVSHSIQRFKHIHNMYNADGSIFIKEKRFNKIRGGILYTDIALFLNNIEIYFC